MPGFFSTFMRWLHLSSMAALVGGALYARFGMARAGRGFSPETAKAVEGATAEAYRPFVFAAIAGILISGFYQILTVPGHSPLYHMLLGVKILLALHVFAVAVGAAAPGCARRARLLTGALISSAAILFIASWLRRIS